MNAPFGFFLNFRQQTAYKTISFGIANGHSGFRIAPGDEIMHTRVVVLAQHTITHAGHSDVGDITGAAGQNPLIRRGNMGLSGLVLRFLWICH